MSDEATIEEEGRSEKGEVRDKTSPFSLLLPWLLVGITILLVFSIRIRLREMPLERDEGEYAYAGQLMLQGVPPYKEAYNMKLPGTYAAYAVMMGLFGHGPSGIHVGLALVNAASIALVFLLGRKLLDSVAGVTAAIAFDFMSLSPSVLGLAAHATHFVILFALAGLLLLLKAKEDGREETEDGRRQGVRLSILYSPSSILVFAAGLAFGFAFLMKQHGLFFGLFGLAYLVWEGFRVQGSGPREPSRRRGSRSTLHAPRSTRSILYPLFSILPFLAGLILPYALTCAVLGLAGASGPFWFWTISYASKYASAIPLAKGGDMLRAALQTGGGPGLLFWLLPGLAAVMMWWEQRLTVSHRIFLTSLAFCSFAAMSIGFYFRPHYFILLLPALALLTGVAVSRALFLLRHDRTIELFLAIPILVLFPLSLGATLLEDGRLYFDLSPALSSRYVYHSTIFTEAAKAAEFVREEGRTQAPRSTLHAQRSTVAVLGSEPEIYFHCLTPRPSVRAATGFIYTYPLMEEHPFARKMQQQMIEEIERAQPEYVIFVDEQTSWLPWPNSDRRIYDWWKQYWANELDLIKTIPIEGAGEPSGVFAATQPNAVGESPKHIFVFKRRGH